MTTPTSDEDWTDGRALDEANVQIDEALESISIEPESYLRWPWPSLHAMTGGMAPGTTHYVVGFSGMGKTTFIASAITRWIKAGVKIDILPLELKANVFRTYLACQAEGIDPGLMLSGDYLSLPDWGGLYERVCRRIVAGKAQTELRIRSTDHIDVEKLEEACAMAQARHATALIVDHIDHVSGKGQSDIAISHAVNKEASDLAKAYNVVLINMSQANNEALKQNSDHLAKYLPLRDTSVWMGAVKRQVCTSMLGLYRPQRLMLPGETVEEFQQAMKRAKAGEEGYPPSTMLAPGRAGITLMKSRNYGAREGQRVQLAVRHGYYDDLNAQERAEDEAQKHGIKTSTGLSIARSA